MRTPWFLGLWALAGLGACDDAEMEPTPMADVDAMLADDDDPCAQIACGAGVCELVDGAAQCVCDEGFVLRDDTCVEAITSVDQLTCDRPDLDGPLHGALTAAAYGLALDHLNCDVPPFVYAILTFDPSGTFEIHEDDGASGVKGVRFGCWSVIEREDDGRLAVLRMDHFGLPTRNGQCRYGTLRPPAEGATRTCQVSVRRSEADALDFNLEGYWYHTPVAPEACVYCSDDAACCPPLSRLHFSEERLWCEED